jgi:hypothetical protein
LSTCLTGWRLIIELIDFATAVSLDSDPDPELNPEP